MDKPISILIADDEELVRRGIRCLLANEIDYQVIGEAENGCELIDKIAMFHPQVVILDVRMPIMDGLDVVDAIRKKDELVPIIIITAYGSIESAEEAVKKGAFDYITKPFRQEQLLISIKRALDWYNLKKEYLELKKKLDKTN